MSGRIIWITGLPGSGKTTLATELSRFWKCRCTVLDADWARSRLWPELKFTLAARTQSCQRLSRVASLLAEVGQIVIVAAVSPTIQIRGNAKAAISPGIYRLMVCLHAPFEVLKARRPSLYKIDYEVPDDALIFDTSKTSVEEIAWKVMKEVNFE